VATGHQIGNHPSRNAIPAWSVVFSPDGNTLASSGADGKIQLWDVATGHQLGKPLSGHAGEAALTEVGSVMFSPHGKTLASRAAAGAGPGDGRRAAAAGHCRSGVRGGADAERAVRV
jgi:WD40 repeat protein